MSTAMTRAPVDDCVPLKNLGNPIGTQAAGHRAQTALAKQPDEIHDSQVSALTSDAVVYPGPLTFWVIYTGLLLATFVIGFDSNCVATIIPVITDEFHSLNDVGWYGTA
jgi:hypothetical protein